MMLHTHLDTAVLAHSERRVHVGEQWAATPQALPATAHYVALGHIHKPQRVAAAPSPTVYAGSPLALDFGEVGEDKSFVVVDVAPGTIPAKIDRVPYEGGLPLADVKGTLEQLRARQSELVDAGWLRVTVPLDAPDPEINRAVRRLLPNAVVVHAELAEAKTAETGWADKDASPSELYAAWHERARGEAPEQPLLDAFGTLYKSQSRS